MPPDAPAMPSAPRSTHTALWLLAGIVLVFVGVYVYQLYQSSVSTRDADATHGSVVVRVLNPDGSRTMGKYDLVTKSVLPDTTIDQNILATTTQSVTLTDGSTITLAPKGIVLIDAEGVLQTVVASPVPPNEVTFLAAWGEGALVAWTSPVDGSVQIFSRTTRGTYIPFLIVPTLRPNTIAFTDDGTELIAFTLTKDSTQVSAINLTNKQVLALPAVSGSVAAIAP